MKLIDRYVITKFISTFLFAIILFTVISIVIDITEKLDDFLDNKIPLAAIAFDYYLNFIPWITSMLMPLFIFITVTQLLCNNKCHFKHFDKLHEIQNTHKIN